MVSELGGCRGPVATWLVPPCGMGIVPSAHRRTFARVVSRRRVRRLLGELTRQVPGSVSKAGRSVTGLGIVPSARRLCPCSSVDRARAFYTWCRRFDPCRGHQPWRVNPAGAGRGFEHRGCRVTGMGIVPSARRTQCDTSQRLGELTRQVPGADRKSVRAGVPVWGSCPQLAAAIIFHHYGLPCRCPDPGTPRRPVRRTAGTVGADMSSAAPPPG